MNHHPAARLTRAATLILAALPLLALAACFRPSPPVHFYVLAEPPVRAVPADVMGNPPGVSPRVGPRVGAGFVAGAGSGRGSSGAASARRRSRPWARHLRSRSCSSAC